MRWLMAPAHYHASDARLAHPTALMPLEILHLALVLFRRRPRFEGAEIAALAGLRIDLSGIEPVLARSQFADHGTPPPSRIPRINRDGRALVPPGFGSSSPATGPAQRAARRPAPA